MNLAPLEQAIRDRAGLLVATGGRQSDRERLCRHLAEQAGRDMCVAVVSAPMMCEEDLIERVLSEFGVVSDDQLRSSQRAGVGLEQMVETLTDFLRGLRRIDATAVLVLEGAQDLSYPAFDGVGLLSDLEDEGTPLLQIVLVGTVDLWHRLHRRQLLPLGERIAVHVDLARGLSRFWTARVSLGTAVVLMFVVSALAAAAAAALYQQFGS